MAKGSRGKQPATNGHGPVPERSNTRASKISAASGRDKEGTSSDKGKGKEDKKNGGLLKWLFKRNVVA